MKIARSAMVKTRHAHNGAEGKKSFSLAQAIKKVTKAGLARGTSSSLKLKTKRSSSRILNAKSHQVYDFDFEEQTEEKTPPLLKSKPKSLLDVSNQCVVLDEEISLSPSFVRRIQLQTSTPLYEVTKLCPMVELCSPLNDVTRQGCTRKKKTQSKLNGINARGNSIGIQGPNSSFECKKIGEANLQSVNQPSRKSSLQSFKTQVKNIKPVVSKNLYKQSCNKISNKKLNSLKGTFEACGNCNKNIPVQDKKLEIIPAKVQRGESSFSKFDVSSFDIFEQTSFLDERVCSSSVEIYPLNQLPSHVDNLSAIELVDEPTESTKNVEGPDHYDMDLEIESAEPDAAEHQYQLFCDEVLPKKVSKIPRSSISQFLITAKDNDAADKQGVDRGSRRDRPAIDSSPVKAAKVSKSNDKKYSRNSLSLNNSRLTSSIERKPSKKEKTIENLVTKINQDFDDLSSYELTIQKV